MNNLGGLGRFLTNTLFSQIKNYTLLANQRTNSAPTPQAPPQNTVNKALLVQKSDIVVVNNELTLLESKETVSYLKQAMQLPDDFSKVLQLLTQNNQNVITSKALKAFIEAHAKNAVVRLTAAEEIVKQKGNLKNSQIEDVLKIVTNLANAKEDNPAALMKSLILLYLPWVPLDKNIDFELQYSTQEDEDGDKIDIITIVIQTIHYGVIKVIVFLNVTDGYSLDIKLFAADVFPKEEFFEDLKQEKEHNTSTNLSYESVKLQKTELKDNKQKIDLQTVGEVNPLLLKISQKIIRLIIDIDKRMELKNTRKKSVN